MKSLDVKWPLQASHSSKVGKTSTERAHSSIMGMTKEQALQTDCTARALLFETLFTLGTSGPGQLISLCYG